jgi:hypothetical protein
METESNQANTHSLPSASTLLLWAEPRKHDAIPRPPRCRVLAAETQPTAHRRNHSHLVGKGRRLITDTPPMPDAAPQLLTPGVHIPENFAGLGTLPHRTGIAHAWGDPPMQLAFRRGRKFGRSASTLEDLENATPTDSGRNECAFWLHRTY